MKKYLISGLGPSTGGVGRLMRRLNVQAPENSFQVISIPKNQSIKNLFKKFKFHKLVLEIFIRLFSRLYFNYKIKRIKNSLVIFL